MLDKKNIRKEMREKRKLVSNEESLNSGALLLNNLLPILQDKNHVAIYHACGGEISLKPTIEYLLEHDVNVYKPISINENRVMRFEQIYSNHDASIFVDKDYKIVNEVECYNLELVLMPLIAADKQGNRLGQGGGYYDTTFATRNLDTIFCGVGYEWQLLDQLPIENHDIKLDNFVSDVRLLNFN